MIILTIINIFIHFLLKLKFYFSLNKFFDFCFFFSSNDYNNFSFPNYEITEYFLVFQSDLNKLKF